MKINVHRHSQILSEQYHGQILVYEATIGHYPRVYNPTIQTDKLST